MRVGGVKGEPFVEAGYLERQGLGAVIVGERYRFDDAAQRYAVGLRRRFGNCLTVVYSDIRPVVRHADDIDV